MPLLHGQSIDIYGATVARAALDRATLPLPLRPLSAVVPRRCRSPKLLRALSEHLPTPMAAERADDAEQCPRRCRCCPAQRCARAHGQQQKGSGLVLRPEVSHQNGCTHRCQTLTVGTSCALGSLPVKVSRRRNHPYSLEMGIDSERIQGPALTETADVLTPILRSSRSTVDFTRC